MNFSGCNAFVKKAAMEKKAMQKLYDIFVLWKHEKVKSVITSSKFVISSQVWVCKDLNYDEQNELHALLRWMTQAGCIKICHFSFIQVAGAEFAKPLDDLSLNITKWLNPIT